MATDQTNDPFEPEVLETQVVHFPRKPESEITRHRPSKPELPEVHIRRGLMGWLPSLQDKRHEDREWGLFQKAQEITDAEKLGNQTEIEGHQNLTDNTQAVIDVVHSTRPGTTVGMVAENNGARTIARMERRRQVFQELLDDKLYDICDKR